MRMGVNFHEFYYVADAARATDSKVLLLAPPSSGGVLEFVPCFLLLHVCAYLTVTQPFVCVRAGAK